MTKIKILIADDNQLTLQSMQNTIPWREWGYELVGFAENGNEAWEKIQDCQPDIVILDIHMPGLNGLEVSSLIQKMEHPPLIILLSAYDKFTYAKAGLRLGVFDYLLKPLDTGELKMILDKASRSLQRTPKEADSLRRDWCEKLLMESVSGCSGTAPMLDEHLAQQWHAYGYSLLLIRKSAGEDDAFSALRSDIWELLNAEHMLYLNAEQKEGRLVLLGFPSLRLTRNYDLESIYLANAIVEKARKRALDIFIGISNYAPNLTGLEKMFEQAEFAAESRFFLENKNVIHYQSVMSKSVHNEYVLSKKMQELFQALGRREADDVLKCLDEFTALLEQDNRYDVDYVRTLFVQIAFSVSSMLDGRGGKKLKTMESIQEEIQHISSLHDMIRWLRKYTESCISSSRPDALPLSAQTKRVLDFLNMNYMKPISLGDAAADAGISESHLCRLLKNETGETFVNILNKIRIQKAEHLIAAGTYKVYEVAELVGFSNYAYFYQVFRKLAGVAPTEYSKNRSRAK